MTFKRCTHFSCLGSDQMPTETILPMHPVATLTFETLITATAKLDLLAKLAEWTLTENDAAETRDKVVPSIRQRSKERNRVAHGLWGISGDLPEDLILMRKFDDNLSYTAKDFSDISDRLAELHMDLLRLIKRLMKQISANGWRELGPGEQHTGMILGAVHD